MVVGRSVNPPLLLRGSGWAAARAGVGNPRLRSRMQLFGSFAAAAPGVQNTIPPPGTATSLQVRGRGPTGGGRRQISGGQPVPHSRALPSRAFLRAREREGGVVESAPPPQAAFHVAGTTQRTLKDGPPSPPRTKKDRRRRTTWGLRREEKRRSRRRRPPCRPAMDKGRKRKISEENRVFNDTWTESFAFTTDETGLPVCLICSEKFANNKKSNIARHFQNKHTAFAEKYPDGDERRKAVAELMRKVDRSKNNFKKWVKSANSTTYASVLATQEIVKHGKPFTDGEYIKEAFIKISEHLYVDFKNKNDIVQKIKDMPLSVCEQVFSNMNYIKNKYRSRLTDDSLQACVKMKVTSYSPDVQTLCTEVQEQKSH